MAGAVCAAVMAGCGDSKDDSAREVGPAQSTTVSAAVVTTTTTTAPAVIYVVKAGDTLTTIAQRFRVPISAIVKFNRLANPDRLTEGQRLRIPPAPPLKLSVKPSVGPPGKTFQLRLTGARPSERVTFEIRSPNKGNFTGPPHSASPDGVVTATYRTGSADPAGTFEVIASGNEGTNARAIFVVKASAEPS
jgi:LysM repeat protein